MVLFYTFHLKLYTFLYKSLTYFSSTRHDCSQETSLRLKKRSDFVRNRNKEELYAFRARLMVKVFLYYYSVTGFYASRTKIAVEICFQWFLSILSTSLFRLVLTKLRFLCCQRHLQKWLKCLPPGLSCFFANTAQLHIFLDNSKLL